MQGLHRIVPLRRCAAFTASLISIFVLGARFEGASSNAQSPPQCDPPAITSQPSSQQALVGGGATFSLAATGADSLQWQRSFDGGASFTDIPGATGDSLTIEGLAAADTGSIFQSRVSSTCGSVVSQPAMLVVGRSIHTVTTNADAGPGSLRQAMSDAAPGDLVDFASTVVSPIVLTSGIALNKNLILFGPGADVLSISGGNTTRLFLFGGLAHVSIFNLTLTQGFSDRYGGAILNAAVLEIRDSVLSYNHVYGGNGEQGYDGSGGGGSGAGGAIFTGGPGSGLTVERSALIENIAQGGSGGMQPLYHWDYPGSFGPGAGGAGFGGALFVESGAVVIRNSTLTGNTAGGGPGGVYFYVPVGQFIPAGTGAGGVGYGNGGGSTRQNGVVIRIAPGFGGGGHGGNYYGSAGSGAFGGGAGARAASVYVGYGLPPIVDGAPGFGAEAAQLVYSLQRYSQQLSYPSGLHVGGAGGAFGGAIYGRDGTISLDRVTMTRNSAFNWATNNHGLGHGGGVFVDGSDLTAGNTILAGNIATLPSTGPDGFTYAPGGGARVSAGFNIVGCQGGFALPPAGGDQIGSADCSTRIDPLLDAAANNGGRTPTLRLKPGSPAFNTGSNSGAPPTDQRGSSYPRIQHGTADIGAFEDDITGPPVVVVNPADTALCPGGGATFTAKFSGGSLYYQWRRNGVDVADGVQPDGSILSGTTTSALTITNARTSATFAVVATNHFGSQGTTPLQLTMLVDVALTALPSDFVLNGQPVTLSAAAVGSELTWQWSESVDGGQSYTPVANGTSQTAALALPGRFSDAGRRYRIDFTGTCGVGSASAALFCPPLTLTAQPGDQTVNKGDLVTLTAGAQSVAPITTQWQQSTDGGATFSDIAGANAFTLQFVADARNIRYRAVMRTDCAEVVTTPVNIDVLSVVTNPDDDGGAALRDVIANAAPGAFVVINAPPSGVITLGTEIPLTRDITITGPGADHLSISGNNVTRIFSIAAGVTAEIRGLTLKNGFAADGRGGAIQNAGNLTLVDSMIAGSVSMGGAGANSSEVSYTYCWDLPDPPPDCGYIYQVVGGFGAGGGGGGGGGAIFNAGSGHLVIDRSALIGNRAIGGHGGNAGWASQQTYPGGGGGAFGGAVLNDGGQVEIRTSTISANRAIGGRGGQLFDEQIEFGDGSGGAGYRSGGQAGPGGGGAGRVGGGGGISQPYGVVGPGGAGGFGGGGGGAGYEGPGGTGGFGGGPGRTPRWYFAPPAAAGFGGGEADRFSELAGGGGAFGGAIFSYGGSVMLNGVTIAENEAAVDEAHASDEMPPSAYGGGLFAYRPDPEETTPIFSIGNSIVTLNRAVKAPFLFGYDPPISPDVATYPLPPQPEWLYGPYEGFATNLIGCNLNFLAYPCLDYDAVPMGMLPLGSYGGPTPTYALLPGSIAVDAGDFGLFDSQFEFDQRGAPRVVNFWRDLGAYELDPAAVPEPPVDVPACDDNVLTITQDLTHAVAGGPYQDVTFTATAAGRVLWWYWEMSANAGGTWERFGGAGAGQTATLTVPFITFEPNRLYRAAFISRCGIARTSSAMVRPNDVVFYPVTNLDDAGPGSLRDAIANAPAGALIDFDSALVDGTVLLTSGEILIAHDVTISARSDLRITVSGNDQSRIFKIDPGVNVLISGLTLSHGRGADGLGGAVSNAGVLRLVDSTIKDSVATGQAGSEGRQSNNWWPPTDPEYIAATGGGGGGGGGGGAIFNAATGSLFIERSSLVANHAEGGAGGTASYGTMPGGGGAGFGGAILNDGGQVDISTSTISGNTAQGGAGGQEYYFGTGEGSGAGGFGYRDPGTAGENNGGAAGVGGGGGAATFEFQELVAHGAGGNGGFGGGGGGGSDWQGAMGGGGGFGGGSGGSSLEEVEAAYGVLPAYGRASGGASFGGAIFTHGGGIRLHSVTMTRNESLGFVRDGLQRQAFGIGGGVFNYGGAVTVVNSIVFANPGTWGPFGWDTPSDELFDFANESITSTTTSEGFNMFGCQNYPWQSRGDTFDNNCHFFDDPELLLPLAINRGTTPTHALPAGSEAIDAGPHRLEFLVVMPPMDQPGLDRVVGDFADKGAVEFNPSLPGHAITSHPQPVFTCAGSPLTLTVSVIAQTPSYQWRFNGVPIPGATQPILRLVGGPAVWGSYDVKVTDRMGIMMSNPAVVAEAAPATITLHPVNRTVAAGDAVTFTARASDASQNWHWEESSDGGASFQAVPGSEGTGAQATLTLGSVNGLYANRRYRAVFGNCITVVSNPATLSVTLLTPSITWSDPAAIVYGTPLGAAQLSATGNVPGTFQYDPPAGHRLHAGPGQALSVTFTPSDATMYSVQSKTVTIGVTKAPLSVIADDASRAFGGSEPAFSARYETFASSDTAASLAGTLALSTPATAASETGDYAIVPAGVTSSDYDITFVNGVLHIGKATPSIVWANPAPIVYGTPLGATQFNAVANGYSPALAGQFTYFPPAGTILPATNGATFPLSVMFVPADSRNYTEASAESAIVVNKAEQQLTFNAIANKNVLDAPFDLAATLTSGLPAGVALVAINGAPVSAACAASGFSVPLAPESAVDLRLDPSPECAGEVTVVAFGTADGNYNEVEPITRTFTIARLTQSIDFTPIADHVIGDAPFMPDATSSSGFPVTFQIVSGPATTDGSLLTMTGTGVVTVRAVQGGSNVYEPADATRSFTVKPSTTPTPDTAPPQITVTAPPPNRPKKGPVTISGMITDAQSGVTGASYVVVDENGTVHASGALTLGANGSYSVTVVLPAQDVKIKGKGKEKDGLLFRITVTAVDGAGNIGQSETTTVVPHDMGKG